ncbi:NADPH:quinone reductase [Sulfitobacter sp. S190]|uniref:NADPH:quinone reductase n=1 Tax=Sulfitobacter sp. S190 TaxID=2867022 RepID=UPI0021A48C52|nr:NADPH:quinone reductase [Sulfitobacter sp. S190]UWR21798.1 NADPH:quinone reductase [Sulfitobacter sp. S190]
MHAITYERFGPASDVLSPADIESPSPGEGEVRVKLSFSGVNPSDIKARAGTRPGVTKPAFPKVIPHSDGSGIIEAVGAGVDPARIGTRVWIWNGQWQRAFGTAATHITLPSAQAVALPDSVSLETGAVLGIPGLTAAEAVFGGGDVAGQTLLVAGAGGTVGFLALQLAKWGGAKVIATCSPRDFDRASAAGADAVIDYRAEDLPARIHAANDGKDIDRITEVEFGVNIACDAEVIAPNGTIAAFGSALDMTPTVPFGPLLFKAVTIDIILIYLLPDDRRQRMIERLHVALDAGALVCPVEAVFELADCAAAHDAVLAGSRTGAILLCCE